MPACSIVKCGARKKENQPQLSMHRFPKNEGLKEKWLEAIGEENMNLRHKEWYVCSLHFEESCFNRTLDVMRLRDNSVPTVFSARKKKLHQKSSVSCETSKIKKSVVSFTPSVTPPLQSPHPIIETVYIKAPNKKLHQESSDSYETSKIKKSVVSFTPTVTPPLQSPDPFAETMYIKGVENENVKALEEKCVKQQQKIKRLNEMIRMKNKKIANLKDIVGNLRRKNCIGMEQAVETEDLEGPGLPTPNKYSEEIRKFALTLHFLSPKAYNYIRQTYKTSLPDTSILSKWFQRELQTGDSRKKHLKV